MTKPLFMYAGGKTRLLKHYIPLMPESIDTYYEPFFGGGAMFLYVMQNFKPKRVIINDINVDVMNIYRAVKDHLDCFLADVIKLESKYLSKSKEGRKSFYFSVRHQHAYEYENWTKTRESAVLYFLMKTGFNGIYQINKNTNNRFGTPAGLLNQTSQIFDRNVVIHWNKLLQNTELYSTDWSNIDYRDNTDTFIFFDPPYRGSFTAYGQQFDDNQQRLLLEKSESFKHSKVFLSNRDINDKFFDNSIMNHLCIPITYTAGRRKKTVDGYEAKYATELLLYN